MDTEKLPTQRFTAEERLNGDHDRQGINFFRTGPGEDEGVTVEEMLMNLATVEMVLKALSNYADKVAEHDGQETEYNEPPDSWAISAAFQDLSKLSHALKCGCWGHRTAFLR